MLLQAVPAPAPDPGAIAARNALFIALGIFTVGFLVVLVRALRARAAAGESIKSPAAIWPVSFVANFLDTLGIGSFATTTSMFRQWNLVPDEKIPGTLNVGYVLPTVVQAYIYTTIVPVDSMTLALMIAAAVLGAWLGAGVVSSWPRRSVQIGMGMCLLGAALLFTSQQLNLTPGGGTLLKLTGAKLAAAVLGNFLLGALMTLGIGLYGPCMILISLLGMNPTAAFPIMMGSCAFLMPMASVRFVRTGGYDVKAIVGMMLAGLPAVLIAAFIVKSLDLYVVKWLVVIVVTYTGVNLLRAASRERRLATAATAAETALP
jgi:uncharacterized membrane protein YfcA